MIRLRLLGPVELHGSRGDDLVAVLAQPKRLSVLAYLASASPRGFHRRDSVVALFWPELDECHARKALNQTLGFLRRELPSDGEVVVSRGSEDLGVDATNCWCDVVAFEEAMSAGRHAEALELYRGDFLQAWFVDRAAGFEEWAERQRARLRGLAADAARVVAEARRRGGNFAGSIQAAQRAVELSQSDERAVRLLLEALDGVGDRAGALKAYAEFERRLAEDLGAAPSAETAGLVDRIRARTVARSDAAVVSAPEVSALPSTSHSARDDVRASAHDPPDRAFEFSNRIKRRRKMWIAIAVVGMAMVVVAQLERPKREQNSSGAPTAVQPQLPGVPRAAPSPVAVTPPVTPGAQGPVDTSTTHAPAPAATVDPDLVAVLPFRVTGADTSLAYLREGMVDLLYAKFTGSLRTVEPRTLLNAWRRAHGERADLDTQVVVPLARRFGAQLVLSGSVTSTASTVVLSAMVRDLRTGSSQHSTVEGPRDSVLALVDRLVTELLAIRAHVDPGTTLSLRDMPLPAVREYLDATYLSRRGQYEQAIPHYHAAIAADSDFAWAGIGLADASVFTSGEDAFFGWGIAARGRSKLNVRDRALLDAVFGPNYPPRAPLSEQRVLAERLVELEPDRPGAWIVLGNTYLEGALHDVHEWPQLALAAFNHALTIDSSNLVALSSRPVLYLRIGDSTHARLAMEQLLRYDSTSIDGWFNLWSAGAAFGNADRRARGLASLRNVWAYSAANGVKFFGFATGIGFEDQEGLLEAQLENAPSESSRNAVRAALIDIAGIRGQPSHGARVVDESQAAGYPLQYALLSAVFDDADSSAVARMRDRFAGTVGPDSTLARCQNVFMFGLYDLAVRHDSTTAATAVRYIDARLASVHGLDARCAITRLSLSLMLSMSRGDENLRGRAESLDSILRAGPLVFEGGGQTRTAGNLILARVWEHLNEPRRALAAVRRRSMWWDPAVGYAAMLHAEARLAAATGDREGAIRAYRIFIALRRDAEPRLQPQIAAARSELARLERSSRRSKGQ